MTDIKYDLKDKSVLITGASRGIGRAIAFTLAKSGAKVFVNFNQSKEMAFDLVERIRKIGGTAFCYKADVREREDVRKMVKAADVNIGRINTVINNAGIADYNLFTEITDEKWNEVLDTHIKGTYNVLKETLPGMLEQKSGCIINISSIWGIHGASMEVAYSTAKGAIIAMTKALAKEMGPSGIRVNAIAPGIIKTDMIANFSDTEIEDMIADIPAGRLGTPEDIAQTAAFLISDEAKYMTGQIITVDGSFI